LAVGKNLDSRMHIEFSFLSSEYTVDDPRGNYEVGRFGDLLIEPNDLRDLNQYNYTGLIGYKIIKASEFDVALRGGLSYVRRNSESSNLEGFSQVNSDAVDAVLGAAGDFRLSNQLYVVGTFDYFTNVTNDIFESNDDIAERVEVSDYFVFGVGLKYEF
jgi:hypothetical protein